MVVWKGMTAMKTKEELNTLKEEVETLRMKLAELNEEELQQVTGGVCTEKYKKDIGSDKNAKVIFT